ncbi:putative ABC transport system ATP-binding protein [Polaromonas sp. YR568]|uniref:ABC transporter ATP-binding protein n=1 Tax=Polaromonas sp. YR568 TaxID=1855301 RepID=UPI0008EE89CD|nr:ATP-binding cassette domain-containing protein [Polaromonas sp. YR568]SFU89177.1 putative ABC transport system ATP-binding protein [Polaromonas sp. YR568]
MISTRQLAYRYAKGPELRFADVEVAQGDTLLLRGASGSGKSTWLALAAGLLAPGEGDITVAGQSLKALGARAGDAWRAKAIGFLPQKLHLSTALTVQGNLAMAQWAAGQPADDGRIAEALDALDVRALAERKPAQLSGGQAQRVALARAVLLKPRVILADEPTASLDDEAAAASLALLQATASQEGATLVIATHDARVAEFFQGKEGVQSINIVGVQR